MKIFGLKCLTHALYVCVCVCVCVCVLYISPSSVSSCRVTIRVIFPLCLPSNNTDPHCHKIVRTEDTV